MLFKAYFCSCFICYSIAQERLHKLQDDLMYGLLTLFQGKRLFIKDITYYLVPPDGKLATIAPSLARLERGVGTTATTTEGSHSNGISAGAHIGGKVTSNGNSHGHANTEPENPTVIPKETLEKFHFTFLIRHPRSSIPSFFRCTVPPLDSMTGFYEFMPSEAGYDELRRVFDYLRAVGQVGPAVAGKEMDSSGMNGHGIANGHSGKVEICVVDADDLLDNPTGIIEAYCKSVGLEYDPGMLNWNSEEDHKYAKEAFEKWKGFHEDAMDSGELRPRVHVSPCALPLFWHYVFDICLLLFVPRMRNIFANIELTFVSVRRNK